MNWWRVKQKLLGGFFLILDTILIAILISTNCGEKDDYSPIAVIAVIGFYMIFTKEKVIF